MIDMEPTTTVADEVQALLQGRDLVRLSTLLESVHPADIAVLMDHLPIEDAIQVFTVLPLEAASEVLDETGSQVRQRLVEHLEDDRLADLLDELPMDDAAEFLEDLPDEISDRLLELMEPVEAAEVQELLAYEEETAGRLMNRDVVTLQGRWTVAETLTHLRSMTDAETLHYLYVVDSDDTLLGVVPLRHLILAQPDATMEDIMRSDIVSVPVDADQEELAELVARYDYFAIPVVDDKGRLLGVVTVDDVLDVFEEEMTEDFQRLGGSEPLDQPYFAVSVLQIVRKRVGWLLLLFVAATLTGSVIRYFEDELLAVLALSLFIPLVTGTGGNAGSQTVTTVIRALALNQVRLTDLLRVWKREVLAGLILGLILGAVGFVRAATWNTGMEVALVVTLTLPVVVIWANTVATIVPLVAQRFRIDPTVVSAPMITTIVDASGLLIYFGLAKLILGL